MLKCLQCGKYTQPGPAACDHCGASLRGAPRVEVALSGSPEAGGLPIPVVVATNRVVVADFDMPFGSMVGFMVKWAIASIPAFIILFLLGMVVTALFAGVFSRVR
jgi:hypothetical protein